MPETHGKSAFDSSVPMVSNISQLLHDWLSPLNGELPKIYIVGGSVRDLLLSRKPKDIDLVCDGAEALARALARTRDAAVVAMEKKEDEPCYRVVDRKHAEKFLDIAQMRGKDLLEDLARRDFTVNAMAIEINEDGSLGNRIDPLHGARDLASGLIREASPEGFASDPLRILRAVRFAGKLGFAIEGSTLDSMRQHVPLLRRVSPERITTELLYILGCPESSTFFTLMDEFGILELLFPETIPMRGCTQNSFHHKDVWGHCFMVMRNCEKVLNRLPELFGNVSAKIVENLEPNNRLPLLKLAALLHDVGKPSTRDVTKETGRITFYGHDDEGAGIMDGIARRLRMSNDDREFLRTLVAEHLHVLNLSSPEVRAGTRMRWLRRMKDDAIPVMLLGISDIKGTLGPDSTQDRIQKHLEWSRNTMTEYYRSTAQLLQQEKLITGKDLMALGIPPGPEMGRILREVEEARDAGEITDREAAIRMVDAIHKLEEGRCIARHVTNQWSRTRLMRTRKTIRSTPATPHWSQWK